MRILKLRFRNLNSLVGEWLIDFTHHAFTDDGIFAIIGPTGAGKSTLLDALSIALFGRTCRMGGLSKSANEVMSRRTGDCFAEVLFETPKGRYLCRWEQRRARGQPDGELQQPRQRIADADGTILTSKIREVAEAVERLTGLDFDRFTRSVLLAQGDFSAFLNADADDRAPLLERITGSEIYTRISIHVHERRGALQRSLELLMAEMGADPILDAVQVQEFEKQRDAGELELKQLKQRLDLLRRIDEKRARAASLEQQQAALRGRQADLANMTGEMAEIQQRLERDHRAQELAEEWRSLLQTRRESDEAKRQREAIGEEFDAAHVAREQALATLERAGDERRSASERSEAGKGRIAEARALDVRLEEKRKQLQGYTETLKRQQRELGEQQRRIGELQEALAEVDQQTEENEAYLEAHAQDARLAESLAGIQERLEQLRKEERQLDGVRKGLEENHQQARRSQERLVKAEKERRELETAQRQVDSQLETIRREIGELGDARELEGLVPRREALVNRRLLLDKALHGLEWGEKARARIEQLEDSLQTASGRVQGLDEALRVAQREAEHWRARSEQLRKLVVLMRKVASLEEERGFLVAGEPCPLCGAREHPFVEHQEAPNRHPDEQGLGDAEMALDEANRVAADTRREHQNLQDEITALRQRIAEENDTYGEEMTRVTKLLEQACWHGEAISAVGLREELAKLSNEKEKIDTTLGQYEQLRGREQRQRAERERLGEAIHEKALACREATHAHDVLTAEGKRLSEQEKEMQYSIEARKQGLLAEVGRFSVDSPELEDPARMQQSLEVRVREWRRRQQMLSQLRERGAVLQGSLKPLATGYPRLERECADQHALLEKEQQAITGLRQQRRTLLGDDSVDVVEMRLHQQLTQADAVWQAARERLNGIEAELESLERRRRLGEQRGAALAAEIERRLEAWHASLNGADFADEEGFRASLLDPAERKALQERLSDHREQRKVLEERLQSLADEQFELARELPLLAQQAASFPGEQLELPAVEARMAEVQRELGAVQRALEEDRNARHRGRERLQRRQALEGELARWSDLHDLIGSADGKKYRNFAQGITFEVMVGYANQALARMSDRYLLVCDDRRPLELMVMDGYQAGEIRSTRNLSGGESFIVSLALALGLSDMVSAGWRVDSLFIDEGFGTLDEHALEAALEALAGLRRSGKLVGVISHVPALRERIATRIRLRPLSGGRSRIEGPGCSEVAEYE